MRVCITGGTGFVGRAVVRVLLSRGHEVVALVRDPAAARAVLPQGVALVPGGLADADALAAMFREHRPQALAHLAWEGLPDYSEANSLKNLDYGTALYGLAADHGVETVLTTGSCWEYEGRQGCLAEDAPLGTAKAFPAAKSALRRAGLALARERGLDFYWLRLFYVYGPGQHGHSLLPTIINAALAGSEPPLRSPGNKNDFVHVDDVALACALTLEKKPGPDIDKTGTYNVGSGTVARVADAASLVYEALGAPVPEGLPDGLKAFLAEAAPPPPAEDFWADMTRTRADTGFVARIGLREGVAGMLRLAQEQRGQR